MHTSPEHDGAAEAGTGLMIHRQWPWQGKILPYLVLSVQSADAGRPSGSSSNTDSLSSFDRAVL